MLGLCARSGTSCCTGRFTVADSLLRPALDDFFRIWTVDTVPKPGLRARTEILRWSLGPLVLWRRTGTSCLTPKHPNTLAGPSCLNFFVVPDWRVTFDAPDREQERVEF